MGKVSSPLIEDLIPDLRHPRGAFVRSGCQPAYTSPHHNPHPELIHLPHQQLLENDDKLL